MNTTENSLLCGAGYRLEQYIFYWLEISNNDARDRNGNPPNYATREKARNLVHDAFDTLIKHPNADQNQIIEKGMEALGRKWPRPEFERGGAA